MNESKEKLLIEVIKDKALKRHRIQDNYVSMGRIESYTTYIAAWDAVEEMAISGTDVYEMFKMITEQTKFIPQRVIGLELVASANSWDEYIKNVCSWIINSELEADHPELSEIDERRNREFDY